MKKILYSALIFITIPVILVFIKLGKVRNPHADRVVLIGIDAADWKFIDPLLKQNKLPFLQSFLKGASYGKLSTVTCKPYTHDAMQWVSLATGKTHYKHGINIYSSDFVPFGYRALYFYRDRRKAKAIWNILSEKNIKVGIVGWRATWPVEKVNGYMISNYTKGRARPTDNINETRKYKLQLTYTGTVYEDKENKLNQTYPNWFHRQIEPVILKKEETEDKKIQLQFRDLKDKNQKFYDIKWNYIANEIFADTGLLLLNNPQLNFVSVVMYGIDAAFHRIDKEAPNLLNDYYIYVDRKLGEYFTKIKEKNTSVMVVSEHGNAGQKGHNFEAIDGVIIVKGPHIKRNYSINSASILDVAPTILYLFNLNIPEDMDGKVLLDIFKDDYIKSHPLKIIDSYENDKKPSPLNNDISAFDDAIMKRLHKIGYLKDR